MNGFRVMGRVMVSGTKNAVWRLWWYQAAKGDVDGKRLWSVAMRGFGTTGIVWFGGGTLWALDALPYVIPAGWFIAVGVFAEVGVEDTEPLPSPTDNPSLEYEEAGQGLEVRKGKLGKRDVLRIPDPNNPARTHLVWLDSSPQTKEAS